MNPIVIALLLSLAANGALGWAYLGQRDEKTTLASKFENAAGAATACSDATEDLRELADQRGAEGKKARAVASDLRRQRDQAADNILTTPPAVAGEDCQSAKHQVRTWLEGRK